jgi:hypothetical protein
MGCHVGAADNHNSGNRKLGLTNQFVKNWLTCSFPVVFGNG